MRGVIGFSINKTDKEVFEAARVAFNDFEGFIKYNYLDYFNDFEEIRLRNDLFAEWRSELIEKYLKGKIGNEDVNVVGYAVRCEQSQMFTKVSRETNFVNKDESAKGYTGVSDSSYTNSSRSDKTEVDLLIERLDTNKEKVIAEFNDLAHDVAIIDGKNLITYINNAIATGSLRYIKPLRAIIEKYGKRELFETVMQKQNEDIRKALGIGVEKSEVAPVFESCDHSEVDYESISQVSSVVDVDKRVKKAG